MEFICGYVRFVQLFRFFHFRARRRSGMHASAHRCTSAMDLCSWERFGRVADRLKAELQAKKVRLRGGMEEAGT